MRLACQNVFVVGLFELIKSVNSFLLYSGCDIFHKFIPFISLDELHICIFNLLRQFITKIG